MKTTKVDFKKAEGIFQTAEYIFLATHERPDGDAIGSLLAMKLGLEKMGKKTIAYCPEKIPGCLNFLRHAGDIIDQDRSGEADLIIGLDYGNYSRLRLDNKNLEAKIFISIDHHIVGEHLGFKIINQDCSSTAEIIYELFRFLEVELDREIATCLLTGIFSDTGGFRHSNTSAQTLRIAGELMLKGALLSKIAKYADSANLPEAKDFWTLAFQNIEIDSKSGMIFSIVSYENLVALNQDFSNSNIANLLCNVPEIKFSLLCAEKEPGKIECSLRSQANRGVDVAAIAKLFGGGGHRLAAGFQTTESPERIIDAIKTLVK